MQNGMKLRDRYSDFTAETDDFQLACRYGLLLEPGLQLD